MGYTMEELMGQYAPQDTPEYSMDELISMYGSQEAPNMDSLMATYASDVPAAISAERIGKGFVRGVLQNIVMTSSAIFKGPVRGATEFSIEMGNMLGSAAGGYEYEPVTDYGRNVKAIEDKLGVEAVTPGQKAANFLSELAPDVLGGIAAGVGRKLLAKMPTVATEATELFGKGIAKGARLSSIEGMDNILRVTDDLVEVRPSVLKPVSKEFDELGTAVANEQFRETSKIVDDVIESKTPAETVEVLQGKKSMEQMLDEAKEVHEMFDRNNQALKEMKAWSAKKLYRKLKTLTVDVSGNIKKKLLKEYGAFGDEAVYRLDLIRGSTGRAGRILEKGYDDIFGGLSKADEELLNRAITSRRNVVITSYKPEHIHTEGIPAHKFQSMLDAMDPAQKELIGDRMNKYFNFMREQADEMYKRGIYTKDQYESLIKHDYSPRRFREYINKENDYYFGGSKKITVRDSGIMSLKEGSEDYMETNARALMHEIVAHNQARIFRNEANQALLDLADQVPENGIVRRLVGKKAPSGHEVVSVMQDGKKVDMVMPNEFAREWILSNPEISQQTANIAGWLSGNKILKPMATGLNPEFALANLPRDIAHAWLTTGEYSSFMPKAGLQMGADFARVAKDVFLRKGRYHDFIDEGGGMSFLTHQGRVTQKGTAGIFGKMQDWLGYLGETSELWTRLALRERALRNGMTADRATWVARNYLDFAQGGSMAKAVDTAVPYLNASIQGTRGLFREASQKPGQFIWKFSQLGGLAAGMYMNNRQDPEFMAALGRKEKANNWIIPAPKAIRKYTDKDGETRWRYIRIPKDQGQRLVTSLFEGLMAKYMGDEVDVEQLTDAAQDMIPMLPTEFVPPTMDALLGYATNTDFWRRDRIWKGQEVTKREEWTAYTPKTYVDIGKATGLSPMRTKHAVEQLFTAGNIYTSMGGAAVDALTGNLSEKDAELFQKEVTKYPFVRRVMRSTLPHAAERERAEKQDIQATTRRYVQNREVDMLATEYNSNPSREQHDVVMEHIRSQPKDDRKRLVDRFERSKKYGKAPDSGWWKNLSYKTPEARAALFYAKYAQSSEADKKQLLKWANYLPGIGSDAFWIKFRQMKRRDK